MGSLVHVLKTGPSEFVVLDCLVLLTHTHTHRREETPIFKVEQKLKCIFYSYGRRALYNLDYNVESFFYKI